MKKMAPVTLRGLTRGCSVFRNGVFRAPRFAQAVPRALFMHTDSYNDTTQSLTEVEGSSEGEFVNDQIGQLSETVSNAGQMVHQVGDLHALGFASYWTPPGLMTNLIEYIHLSTGLPWYATVAAITLSYRLLLFPLVVKSMGNSIRFQNIQPQTDEFYSRMKGLSPSKDAEKITSINKEYTDLLKKHGLTRFGMFRIPLIQMSFAIPMFLSLNALAKAPIESLKTGGVLWFTDLTAPDAWLILPLLSALTTWQVIERGAEGMPALSNTSTPPGGPPKSQMIWFMRALCLASPFFTASFPQLLFMYWAPSNIFSLVQLYISKTPYIKKLFNHPELIVHPPGTTKPPMGFKDGFKIGMLQQQKPGNSK